MEAYEAMNEDDLLVNLESTLSSALSSEARGDADAAVAKTAAIKNIQKALTVFLDLLTLLDTLFDSPRAGEPM